MALPIRVTLLLIPGLALAALNEPVKLDSGLVSGVAGKAPSVTIYKGIPYAAPPVGDLRWRAPQAPAKWEGVRAADKFGDTCTSGAGGGGGRGKGGAKGGKGAPPNQAKDGAPNQAPNQAKGAPDRSLQ